MNDHDEQFLDDLARVIRRHFSGLIRPLWADLPEAVRQERRDAAAEFTRFLEANGFTIQRTSQKETV